MGDGAVAFGGLPPVEAASAVVVGAGPEVLVLEEGEDEAWQLRGSGLANTEFEQSKRRKRSKWKGEEVMLKNVKNEWISAQPCRRGMGLDHFNICLYCVGTIVDGRLLSELGKGRSKRCLNHPLCYF